MTKQIFDGWHDVGNGFSVRTEGGRVVEAKKGRQPRKVYKRGVRGWWSCWGCRYETLLRGLREGRYAVT